MRTSPASQSTKKKGTALANSPPTDVADRILRSDFTSSGALMSATNGKPPGRPPHKHSKAVPPKPGDEQGAYTRAQLVRFDNRFRSRLCAPSGAARRAVRPPLARSRLLVGGIIKRSLKLRRCRLSCVTLTCCRRPPGVPCGTSEVIMPTANSSASKEVVTAALLVIGSKILSGRTKDQN